MRLPRWWPWVSRRRHRRALDQMHRNMLAGFEAVERQREDARAEVDRLKRENRELRGYVVSAHRTIDRAKGNDPCTCRSCVEQRKREEGSR